MGTGKNSQVWLHQIDDKTLSKMIRFSLKNSHKNQTGIIKRVSRKTHISAHTLNKWYQGQTLPNALYLLTLCQHYPVLLECIIAWVVNRKHDYNDWKSDSEMFLVKKRKTSATHEEKMIRINFSIEEKWYKKLNTRQIWFMSELNYYSNLQAKDISSFWGVDVRTARHDTNQLLKLGLIDFFTLGRQRYFFK